MNEENYGVATQSFKNEVATVEQPLGQKLPMSLGQWEATEEQLSILFKDVDEGLVEIKYDGTVYVPWMEYARRLRDAFGVSWAMLPDKDPYIKNNTVLWPFWLIIRGHKVAYAVGANEYNPQNPRMSWDDCLEAAQSNALMRCCKHIGMFLELWQPEFIRNWKSKYVKNNKKVGTENKPDPKPHSRNPNTPNGETTTNKDYMDNFDKIIQLLSLIGGDTKEGMQGVFQALCTAKDAKGKHKEKVSQLNTVEQKEFINILEHELSNMSVPEEETQEGLF